MSSRRGRPSQTCISRRFGDPVIIVELTRGATAYVDLEDWERIRNEYSDTWYLVSNGQGRFYAAMDRINEDGKRVQITLQRAVMAAKPGQVVKTISADSTDCRKRNLYFASKAEQRQMARRRNSRTHHHRPEGEVQEWLNQ